MHLHSMMDFTEIPPLPLELAVRIGCKLTYQTAFETSMLLNLKPRHDSYQMVAQELLEVTPVRATSELEDDHGNAMLRLNLQPGVTEVVYDAITLVPALSEDVVHLDQPLSPGCLPPRLLRYTLPSRYCDSDKLRDFAWQQFGQYRQGLERIQAIGNWLHENIEYRTGSGSPEITAYEVIQRGYAGILHIAVWPSAARSIFRPVT
jgi:transglutaminase-like putative cysteine protease